MKQTEDTMSLQRQKKEHVWECKFITFFATMGSVSVGMSFFFNGYSHREIIWRAN